MTGLASAGPVTYTFERYNMPGFFIIGDGGKSDKSDKMDNMSSLKKPKSTKFGGIGGEYMDPDDGSDTSEDVSPEENGNARKLEAGKLLLRAIKQEDPKLAAEAVTTLVECADKTGGDGSGEME